MNPFVTIYCDGQDVTGGLSDRLLSIRCVDEAEDKSDRVEIEVDDRARFNDGAVAAIPLVGQIINVTMGYRGGSSAKFGPYLIDAISVESPPRILKVTGRSAAMHKAYRTPRTESYHQMTLGAIMGKIAGRNGYSAAMDPELSGVVVRHADQRNESDMSFATRLAADYDAVARPVAGRLAVSKRGTGKAVTGAALTPVVLTEQDCEKWTFTYSARDEAGEAGGLGGSGSSEQGAAGAAGDTQADQFDGESFAGGGEDEPEEKGGVRAYFIDIRDGETKEAEVGKEPFHDLRYTFHNEAEAQAAAEAYRNKSLRGKAAFSCTTGGNPTVQAEAKLVLAAFRPYIPADWRIKSATHSFTGADAYTTDISAELFAEKQADVPGRVKKTKPADDDKIDEDAPPEAVTASEPVTTEGEYIIDLPE